MRVSPVQARPIRRQAPWLLAMALLILSLGLAGCGNKGPLQMPDKQAAATLAR
jgi:predicted small lipoprotein YifL